MLKEIMYSKNEKELLAVKTKYNFEAIFFYTIDYNNEFYFGVEEFDFKLEGYQIRTIKDFENVEIINNFSSEINKNEGLIEKIVSFNLNLESYFTIFSSLKELNKIISIEHEYLDDDYFFLIGEIVAVDEELLTFRDFDINGKWSDELSYIPFELITTIRFNSHYTNTWEKYIR